MSIIEALKTLNTGKDSINELAALPQNEIIRMAQMGRIPADILPVIISEKARITKDLANLQAQQKLQQQGGNQPTVLEQAMQTNEAPPQQNGMAGTAQPQQAPQVEPGLAGLPTGDMFAEKNFQAGGTVGSAAQERKPGTGPSSLAEMLAEYQNVKAPYSGITPERQAELDYLKQGSLSKEDIEQQKNMRMLEAGLGIMGGESPYALTNIARGTQSALKGYSDDLAAQRATKLADLRTRANIADAKRAEDIADVGHAAKMYDSYLEREMRRQEKEEALAQRKEQGKSNQYEYAENYMKMKRASGDNRPAEVLLDEGFNKYFQNYGLAQQKTAAQTDRATSEQDLTRDRMEQEAAERALSSWNGMSESDPRKREYRKLSRLDAQQAEAYRVNEVRKLKNEILGKSTAPVPHPENPKEPPAVRQSPLPPTGIAALPATPRKPDIKNIQGVEKGAVFGDYDVTRNAWPILKFNPEKNEYEIKQWYGNLPTSKDKK